MTNVAPKGKLPSVDDESPITRDRRLARVSRRDRSTSLTDVSESADRQPGPSVDIPRAGAGSRAATEMRASRLNEVCAHFVEMEPPSVREALQGFAQRQLLTVGEQEGSGIRGG